MEEATQKDRSPALRPPPPYHIRNVNGGINNVNWIGDFG